MRPFMPSDFVDACVQAHREAGPSTPDPPTVSPPRRRRRLRGPTAALLARLAGSLDRDRAARALFPGW
jgi:hypothetical protein